MNISLTASQANSVFSCIQSQIDGAPQIFYSLLGSNVNKVFLYISGSPTVFYQLTECYTLSDLTTIFTSSTLVQITDIE